MGKTLILLILFYLSVFNLSVSQTRNIEGRIIDKETKVGISGASVYILDTKDLIIDYVYTDEKGAFNIEMKQKSSEEGRSIVFSFLGYVEQKHLLIDFMPNTIVELIQTEIPLPEVKIVSRPIKEQGDTLIYNVARFKMPQNRSIADVLRNMPGIKVSDDGSIFYQGEPINKFYIEGIDMLDDKYKLVSNNLGANYVENVQILQQHEPVKSLRGKTFSEQAAINLELNEEAKRGWLFSVDLGIGLPHTLLDNRLMAMSFGKTSQNLSMYKSNNTGDDIASELSSPSTISEIIINSRIPKVENGLFYPTTIFSLPIDKNKYQFNNSHLITSNHVIKLSEDKDMRYQISYLNNIENQRLYLEQSYVLDTDSTLVIEESKKTKSSQNKLEGEVSYNHNADNFYLKNKMSSTFVWDQQDDQSVIPNYTVEEHYNLPQQLLRNDFRIVIPRKKGRLEATSLTQFSILPHDAEFKIGYDSNVYNYSQEYKFKNFTTSNQLLHLFQLNNYQVKSSFGLDIVSQMLHSLMRPPALIDILEHENDVDFRNITSYVGTQIGYKSDKLEYYFTIFLNHTSVKINNEDSLRHGSSFVRFLPSFGLKYYLSNWLTLSLKGKITDNVTDLRTIFPQKIFINYRTLNSFTGEPTQNLSHRYSLSIAYRNPINGFFMDGYVGYSINERQTINKTFFIDNLFQQNETQILKNYSYSPILGISASKMFAWWKAKLFMNGNFRGSEYSYIVQNHQTFFSSKSYSVNFRFSIQPNQWINNEYEFNYINNVLEGNNYGSNSYSSSYFQHSLKTYLFPNPKIQVGILQDYFRTEEEKCYFVNFDFMYKLKTMDIGMQIKNISNQTHFIFENIGGFYKSRTIRYMRPREFMIKLHFNF